MPDRWCISERYNTNDDNCESAICIDWECNIVYTKKITSSRINSLKTSSFWEILKKSCVNEIQCWTDNAPIEDIIIMIRKVSSALTKNMLWFVIKGFNLVELILLWKIH